MSNESFDGTTFVPAGWTNFLTSGSNSWTRVTAGTLPTQSPHSGAGEAKFDSYDYSGGIRSLITPPFSLVNNTSGAVVGFWMYRDNGYNTTPDKIDVMYNTSANPSGATLLGTVNRAIGLTPTVSLNGWYQYTYTIPNTVTSSAVYLIFRATSAYGNNTYIDDVSWTAYPNVCSGTPAAPAAVVTPSTGCPGAAFNIGTTGASNDQGITFQWESSTTSSGPWSAISGATLSSFPSATSTTTYYRMITTCTNSGLSSTTSAVSYSVVNPGPCLCSSYATSNALYSGDEEILGVAFGSMVNLSTCSSVGPGPGSMLSLYSNYAGFVTASDACRGQTVAMTVTVGTCNGNYSSGIKVFIDYNQNGVFTDAGEQAYVSPSSTNGPYIASFVVTIPTTALSGLTRMRVVNMETGSPSGISSTGTYGYGETEDYCVNILPFPAITLSSSAGSVCPGQAFNTTAGGAVSYTVNGGAGSVSGSAISLSPIVNTTYTITGTGANGCRAILSTGPQVTVTTLASPDITVAATSTAICIGSTATLTASGANTYTWGASTISPTLAVNPGITTVYTVSGTGTNVCNGVKNYTLVVNTLPTVAVNSGTICAGLVFTMTPSGASTYTYSSGSNTVSPTSNASYSVTGTSAEGCVSQGPAIADVTVVALPVVTAASGTICSGTPFNLQPSGAVTYTVSGGSTVVSPTVTSSYTVTGTSSVGCISAPAVTEVTVLPLPVVGANLASATICVGTILSMTATGAVSYTWNASTPGTTYTAAPATSTTYFVYGMDANGCLNYHIQPVTVNPLPNLSLAGNTFVCLGSSSTLTAGGSATYSWSTGATTPNLVVTPTITTLYTVVGSNTLGCSKTLSTEVNVNTVVLTLTSNTSICRGNSITLYASGPVSYTWAPVFSLFNQVTVSPTVTSVYSVSGTDIKNCPHSRTVTITVNPTPTVSASSSHTQICTNESATLSATGAATYSWTNLGSGASVVVTPTVPFQVTYTVVGLNAEGCPGSATTVLKVSACTGVSEGALAGINVFPNPNTGRFAIELANGKTKQLEIYDVTGRVVLRKESALDVTTLDLSDYANGVYYLNVLSDGHNRTVKIIKN